jgi:DNA-binding MarR family transcriptional regulator
LLDAEYDNKDQDTLPPNGRRIYEYIVDNPSCHVRKISRELDLAIGDTQYHLKILEKKDLIKSRRVGLFRMYYAVAIFRERQQSILAVLGQEVPRDIILFLIESPGATQIDIARHESLTPPTINWHMSRLIEIGLVSRRKKGKFVKYYTQGDTDDITNILKIYYPSLWSKLSNRLAEVFLDLSVISSKSEDDKKMLKTTDDSSSKDKERSSGDDNHI